MRTTPEVRALARATLRQQRPVADVELSNRWDALEALALVRRNAHLIQLSPSRWIVRVSAAGRKPADLERDIAAIEAWARDGSRDARIVAGELSIHV
jgi:hypothetical protein